jgi:glycosyltransferase involved in cell wall biosynthesis
MKDVFIISSGPLVKSKTAGSQRVINIAKSLAEGNINVFICSLTQITRNPVDSIELYPGVYFLQSRNKKVYGLLHLWRFLGSVNRFIKGRNSESVIYLYPTIFILKDFIYLLYFKMFRRYKLYCDINELRVTNAFISVPPDSIPLKVFFYIRFIYYYIPFKLSEFQVPFYNGIVVISSNLEQYFSRYTQKIIRVPILCDVSKIPGILPAIHYDGSTFKICFAGFINCDKEGFDTLFEALYEVNLKKNVELYLYGILIDKDRDILNHLTEKYMLRNKVFHMGNIDPDDLSREFSSYNLLILPRPLTPQAKYGFSTKLSEYLISGVPVLITDVSDNAIYIKDNYNGYIVSPGSLPEMVNKILEIIDNYNSSSSRIAGNACQTAREYFDYKLYTTPFSNFFFKPL